jgi:hypothetical protein
MTYFSNDTMFPHVLTNIQHQVFIGSMLGDGSLEKSGRNPRLKIDRQLLDKAYLEWEYDAFKGLCKSGVKEIKRYDKRYNKTYEQVSFRTRAIPAFKEPYQEWYPNNGKKIVPFDLKLTPLILAIWFADDGSVTCSNNGDGSYLRVKLSTENFGYGYTKILHAKLEDYFQQPFILAKKNKRSKKDQWIIRTTAESAKPFLQEIESDVQLVGMYRKYDIWKNVDLNKANKLGLPFEDHRDMYDLLLTNQKGISINGLAANGALSYDKHSMRSVLNDWVTKDLAVRFESNEKFNPFKYKLTINGIEYVNSLIEDLEFQETHQ